jgi:glycine/serine hydroxymethyltransferase
MRRIGAWIADVLSHATDAALLERVRGQVRELGRQFPAPTAAA